jgi:hypothetical protein
MGQDHFSHLENQKPTKNILLKRKRKNPSAVDKFWRISDETMELAYIIYL